MNAKDLIASFYADIWNRGDLTFIPLLLRHDFTFRGSLGSETRGHADFAKYVNTVRAALSGYRCDILDLVGEGAQAFARMRFSGVHSGPFLGYGPSGKRVEWMGAALFTMSDGGQIADLWVLGDVHGLLAQLRANAAGQE